MYIANSSESLIDHSINVAKEALSFSKSCGIDDVEILKEIELSALLHDIGKVVVPIQSYLNNRISTEGFKLHHHEISWAFLLHIIKSQKYQNSLNSIYWHHPKPSDLLNKYQTASGILTELSQTDIQLLYDFYNIVKQHCSFSIEENQINIAEYLNNNYLNEAVPEFFNNYENYNCSSPTNNLKKLIVRIVLIYADRKVSANLKEDVINELSIEDIKLNCDINRYTQQLEISKLLSSSSISQINAPCGFGKTMIGLLWGILQKK